MTTYLKAANEAALYAALEAAGLVTADPDAEIEGRKGYRHNVFLSVIGTISQPTGELDAEGNPVYAPIEGFHANIYAPITDEQREMLPVIGAPKNPVRVSA